MQRADQPRVIGMEADRHQIDVEVLGLEDDVGARDGDLADPALPKTAADHDALGVRPCLGLQEPAGHIGQFLREFLDRAMHQRGGGDIVAHQHLVEVALGNFVGGFLAERIVAVLLQRLAQPVEDVPKSTLAGPVAEKAVVVLQFDIEAVDVYRRQPRGAVTRDAGGRYGIICHIVQCPLPDFAGNNGQGTHWFHAGGEGEWRMASDKNSLFATRYSPFRPNPAYSAAFQAISP